MELKIKGYEIQGRENETLSKQFELTILKILRAHVVWSDSGRSFVMIIWGWLIAPCCKRDAISAASRVKLNPR